MNKPTVIFEKVILQPITILFISDTADDMTGLNKVLATDYSELFSFVNRKELKPGKVMAFYLSDKKPVLVEVAVEVDKLPGSLSGKIRSKTVAGEKAIVAHYKGPYEQMEIAYHVSPSG